MKLFFAYLRQRWKVLLGAVLFYALFAVSFALYGLPLAAVWYPAALTAVLGLIFFLCDFGRIRRTHAELSALSNAPAEQIGPLPETSRILDGDYQAIIRSLQVQARQLASSAAAREREASDYYTVWAHQIKTPIAAMELTLRQEDSPQARRLLGELSRIEQYVEMALTYLRLESAESDYVFRDCALDPIIRQSVKRFSAEFIGRKIRLDYEPADYTLVTDEKWLGFVLEQLLSNALKYTRAGSVRIFLQNGTLCIADTGIGIAPEDLPRIFEKGYTGLNGRTDRKATGLGLYLCRRVCENLGIGLRAESTPGTGTTVFLELSQRQRRFE